MDFNQEGDRFATAGKDHCVRVYDTETLKVCDFVFTENDADSCECIYVISGSSQPYLI